MTNRIEGLIVPVDDVSAHLANGWSIADDLLAHDGGAPFKIIGHGDVVVMTPPAEQLTPAPAAPMQTQGGA